MAVNSVVYQGRMTKDVELKTTQGGISFANFTLAWSEKYKETENKCFLRCKAWRQTAEFIDKFFHAKGSEVLVEGRLETEEWEKDGQKQSMTVLNVSRAHFCGKRQDAATTTEQAHENTNVPAATAYVPVNDEDELPF